MSATEQKDWQDHSLSTFLNPTVCRGKQAESFLSRLWYGGWLCDSLLLQPKQVDTSEKKYECDESWLTSPSLFPSRNWQGEPLRVSKCGSLTDCFVIWGSWYNSFLLLFTSQGVAMPWGFLISWLLWIHRELLHLEIEFLQWSLVEVV